MDEDRLKNQNSYKGDQTTKTIFEDMFNLSDKTFPPVVYQNQLCLMCYRYKLSGMGSREMSDILNCSHVHAQKLVNTGRSIFWNCFFVNQLVLSEFLRLPEGRKGIKDIPVPIREVFLWLSSEMEAESGGKY